MFLDLSCLFLSPLIIMLNAPLLVAPHGAISTLFSAITSLSSGRCIVKLDTRDEAALTPLYKAFAAVHSDLLMMQELSLFVGDWDDELMLVIVTHFPKGRARRGALYFSLFRRR